MIKQLWNEHRAAKFPKDYSGEEIEGIDLVLLDMDVAGCILKFLQNGSKLDLWTTAILGLHYRDLTLVRQELEGEAKEYFQRLETLSRLVLEKVRDNIKTKWL
ncbi:MAG: hypothetical protein DWQ07_21420 [Chloroflexi bacterium]|nr:MAG: hypothetical protein DWQ07_21420 [Chloroflexota bacterium]MBL1196618.1 hypothetical protein [Chloroflexota bacterium]NOH13911.1 hypothetical protein [Chloroflexota bacterium]